MSVNISGTSFVDMSNDEIPNNMARTVGLIIICQIIYVLYVICNSCLYVVPIYQRSKICNNIYLEKVASHCDCFYGRFRVKQKERIAIFPLPHIFWRGQENNSKLS